MKRLLAKAVAAVVVCAFASGCNDAIEGLKDVEQPLLRIRVQVKGEIAKLLPPGETMDGLRLRAALVWGAVPNPPAFCLEYGLGLGDEASATTVAHAGCKSVFAFVPKLVQASAPLQADGSATIELLHLPTAEVLVGSPSGRVAHASVVIYDDRDMNDALVLRRGNHHYVCRENGGGPNGNRPTKCPPENDPPNGEGKGGDRRGSGAPDASNSGDRSASPQADAGTTNREGHGGRGGDRKELKPLDFVYGASFQSMLLPHVRLTYREGTYDLGSFFYPTIGCSAPPNGFSVVHVSGAPTKATCDYKNVQDEVIEVPLQATTTVGEVVCERQNFHFHDSRRKPDLEQPWVCIDGNALVGVTPRSPCRALSAVSLRGCRSKHDCNEADWDDHLKPPDWWPCGTYIEPTEKKNQQNEARRGAGKGDKAP